MLEQILFWIFFAATTVGMVLVLTALLLKRKVGLLALGFVTFGYAWLFGAIRLAKPDSIWARRFYGAEKTARARDRFKANR